MVTSLFRQRDSNGKWYWYGGQKGEGLTLEIFGAYSRLSPKSKMYIGARRA